MADRSPLVAALLVLALVMAACSSGGDNGGDDEAAAPTPTAQPSTPTTVPTPFPTVDDVPDAQPGVEGVAAERIDQIVEWLNGEPFDEAMYEETFSDSFRTERSFADFSPPILTIAGDGPWTIDRVEVATPDAQKVVIVNPDRTLAWSLELVVSSTGEVDSALLSPARVEPPAPVVGFADAVADLNGRGELRFLIAAPANGQCNILANQGDTELMPIGSMFKLYVLGAVVEAARSGDLDWDDPVVIDDALDSIPTGITQDDAPGTELTVRELALRMISISDNTATDHLIALVGRDAVEAVQARMGHGSPEVNRPFLTTRELTILKVSAPDELVTEWIDGGEADRRDVLDQVAALPLPPLDDVVDAFSAPVLPTEVEWFASPRDLCQAFDFLIRDASARSILTEMPLEPNPALWLELGFKGGSEPGVLATGWWMRTVDNEIYVAVIGLVDETAPIDEVAAIESMVVLRDSTRTLSAG